MKKLLTLVLAGMLAACTSAPAASQETVYTFQDDLDRTIEISAPKRTAAMIGSFADLWLDAGGQDSLVATAHDAWTTLELPLDENVADLGAIKQPSMEVLLASSPDLVLASAKNASNLAMEDTLSAAGIPVAYFDVSTFDDYLRMLKICTDLTGDQAAYENNGLAQQAQIEEAKAKADGSRPTVLYIRAAGSSVKVKNSKDSVLGTMLADLDTENIADSEEGLLENLSMESILQADPDWIFVVLQGDEDGKASANLQAWIDSQPAWNKLQAVAKDRVIYLDGRLYNLKPNDQWAQAYMQLAEILYGK